MNHNLTLIMFVIGAFVLASCSQPSSSSAINNAPTETVTLGETPVATDGIPADETPPSDALADNTALLIDTSSSCYNPFFPVSEDASWTFQYDTGETFVRTIDVTGEDTFTANQTVTSDDNVDLVASVNYFCTEEGILQEFTQIDVFDELGEETWEFNLTTAGWTGHTLPNPDEMDVGSTWTATYTLTGDITIGGLVTTAEGTVTINYVISAIEEVTVPAGTFQAYRVDNTTEMEIALNMGGSPIPVSGEVSSASIWYVEDLGMIKDSETLEGGSVVNLELIDSNVLN